MVATVVTIKTAVL